MKSIKDALQRAKRGPSDVVGIDLQPTEVRVARLRKTDQEITLVGMETLPGLQNAQLAGESDAPVEFSPLIIPPRMRSKHAALCLAGDSAIIKLLSFPGQFTAEAEEKVIQNLGIEDASKYRVSYKLVTEGHGKSESRVLAVAVPEGEAAICSKLLPSGLPAPFSIELSPLALLTTFLNGPGAKKDEALGSVEFGLNHSTLALLNKAQLVLVRRFPVGSNSIVAKVQESLGVDRETAQGIMSDGAFDISQSISEVMEPLIKQLIVSRDFVERRESCHIAAIHVSGALRLSSDLLNEIKSALSVEAAPWDPLQGLTIAADAIPESLKNQTWSFGAAIGACLGAFEDAA